MYVIRATYIPRNDIHFDRDYYLKNHIPLRRACNPDCPGGAPIHHRPSTPVKHTVYEEKRDEFQHR